MITMAVDSAEQLEFVTKTAGMLAQCLFDVMEYQPLNGIKLFIRLRYHSCMDGVDANHSTLPEKEKVSQTLHMGHQVVYVIALVSLKVKRFLYPIQVLPQLLSETPGSHKVTDRIREVLVIWMK